MSLVINESMSLCTGFNSKCVQGELLRDSAPCMRNLKNIEAVRVVI